MKEDKKEHNCGSCVDACANPPVGEILLDIDLLRREHSTVLAACLSSCIFPSLFKYMSPKFFLFEVFFPFFFFPLDWEEMPKFLSPGGRCQFTSTIFCYLSSSALGVNQTWTASFWWLLDHTEIPTSSLFNGCWDGIRSDADAVLHSDTSPAATLPASTSQRKCSGRAVVGSCFSFCSFSVFIIIGSSFQWMKRSGDYQGMGLPRALGVFIFLYVFM